MYESINKKDIRPLCFLVFVIIIISPPFLFILSEGNKIINQNITEQQPDSLVTVKLVVLSLPPSLSNMVTLLGNVTGSNFTKRQMERLIGL